MKKNFFTTLLILLSLSASISYAENNETNNSSETIETPSTDNNTSQEEGEKLTPEELEAKAYEDEAQKAADDESKEEQAIIDAEEAEEKAIIAAEIVDELMEEAIAEANIPQDEDVKE